jgi:NitT/TauT family transport system ATP-binding protein
MLDRPPGDANTPYVVVDRVSHRFGDVEVLRDLSFALPRNGRLAILGPSGSGKSTLLSRIAGLRDVTAGSISIGAETSRGDRLEHCVLMPQKDLLLPWRSAIDNACLALENSGIRKKEARRRATPLFERAGLADFKDRSPSELSGGMRQRVGFLRTLLADKDVLLLDEPFGALDSLTRSSMQEWLLDVLAENPRTLVLVTHDVEEALLLADQVLVLSARPGRVTARLESHYRRHPTRRETISTPEFVELKGHALEALEH